MLSVPLVHNEKSYNTLKEKKPIFKVYCIECIPYAEICKLISFAKKSNSSIKETLIQSF